MSTQCVNFHPIICSQNNTELKLLLIKNNTIEHRTKAVN